MTAATWRLRILAAVTVTATAAISFTSIQHLAAVNGFGAASWLFPLTLDAAAAVGLDLWARRARAWREAAWLAMVAIGLSLVANTLDHWITTGTVLAAVLGAFPPAMLGGLLLVLHRHANPDRTERSGRTEQQTGLVADRWAAATGSSADSNPVPAGAVETRAAHSVGVGVEPERTATAPTPTSSLPDDIPLHAIPSGRTSKLERGRAWFHTQVQTGREPAEVTAAEVDRAIGSAGYAKKHIQAWRDECAEGHTESA